MASLVFSIRYDFQVALPRTTSWSLIELAASGDAVGREEFARRYDPVVRSVICARWKLSREHADVDDATQEVFVRCFRENGPLARADRQRPQGFRAYLYGIVRNVTAEAERREGSRREVTGDQTEQLKAAESREAALSQVFERAWHRLILQETAELLDRRATGPRRVAAQSALHLRMHGGVKPAEIATRLGIEVSVVYELIREAKAQYRAAFLEVMASHYPDLDEAGLLEQCREFASGM